MLSYTPLEQLLDACIRQILIRAIIIIKTCPQESHGPINGSRFTTLKVKNEYRKLFNKNVDVNQCPPLRY